MTLHGLKKRSIGSKSLKLGEGISSLDLGQSSLILRRGIFEAGEGTRVESIWHMLPHPCQLSVAKASLSDTPQC